MYKNKYSPEESLKLIKLRMNYDSKKTLNENIEMVEQIDISGHIRDINDEVNAANSNEGDVIKILKNYTTRADFEKLAKAYQEKYGRGIGQSLYSMINTNDPIESAMLKVWAKELGMTAEADSIPGTNGREWEWKFGKNVGATMADGLAKGVEKTKETLQKAVKDKTTKTPAAPAGLDVKNFQDWLDKNKPGWATGYPNGLLNKAGGYGRFGPRTSAAWAKYEKEYSTNPNTPKTDDEAGFEGGGALSTEVQPD